MKQWISDAVKYVGVDDPTLDLFESQYTVPEGICYNSYIIFDEKVAIMDCVDDRAVDQWLVNVENTLAGRVPDYLVVLHMEPDHSAGIARLVARYPSIKIVGNDKTFKMMEQFFSFDLTDRMVVVDNAGAVDLGMRQLQFYKTPMVHWPEVMMAYDTVDKTLYSADAFGRFALYDYDGEWVDQARRYYYNIVGKYGANVQAALKKLKGLDVQTIAPLHGNVLTEDIGYYLGKYNSWSLYQPDEDGVLVAYASIYGNTKRAAERMAELLTAAGAPKVQLLDLTRGDLSFAVDAAMGMKHLVLAASSYDAGLFPPMVYFLSRLKSKGYCGRKVAIIENATWAATAGKVMREMLDGMKKIELYSDVVTIRSAYKPTDDEALAAMAAWICE